MPRAEITPIDVHRGVRWTLAILALAAAPACGENVILIDPPVTFENTDAGTISGDPAIELGLFDEQFFTPVEPMGPLPIVNGFQGGTWVMPAIRAVALVGLVRATGRVTLDGTGEVVGFIEDPQARLQPTPAGYSELIALPIPIGHAVPNEAAPIDDLYGKTATLVITVVDGNGRTATSTLQVVLAQG